LDWKEINQQSPKELLAYINKYPTGSITDVAHIKYQAQLNKIDELLNLASDDLKRGRYISPLNRNATFRYKTILELDRENKAAIKGLKKLVIRMLSRVKAKIKRRKYTEATEILSFAEEIDPGCLKSPNFGK